MALKFRRGTTAQKSGSLAFGEPYVNTDLGTLQIGGASGDITLGASGTGSTGTFGAISGSGLDITGNANIAGNVTVGGQLTIGDQTSDTVNVVASLSSSLIPQTTNAFDLGSASKIWRDLYISTGSIKFVDGTTVVGTFDLNSYNALKTSTGSANVSISNLNTTTASLAQRIAANEAVSGTFARTNSTNTFNGTQTISGSLFVTQDVIVQGSSSIQNISSSNLVIGAAYVTLNTFSPTSRYAGLNIIDSGSNGGSGSLWYDSVQDEFIQIHKGNGTNVTSSHFVQGPQTYDNLGNETYLTNNKLVKGTGLEHIVDSTITDDGTTVSIANNIDITGSIKAPQLNTLATYTGSVETRLSTLATTTGSLQTSVSNINTFTASMSTTSNVRFGSLGIGMAASGTSGRIDASGDIVAYSTSDKNFKENITPIPNAIDKIRKISGNTYDWKVELKDIHGFEGNDVGVIAQEIEEVLPQLVTTRETGYKAVKYDKIVALLIEGIKEQQQHIDNLTIQVEELKKQKGL